MANVISSTTLLLVHLSSYITAQTPNPIPDCSACWCKSPGDCPDPKYACPVVKNCKTAVVKDKCGCCDVCLKDIGEACRKNKTLCVIGDLHVNKAMMHGIAKIWNPVMSKSEDVKKGRNRCYDLVTNKYYRTGEIWIREDFACTVCACKTSGHLNCWGIKCNVPGCKRTARIEGRCCRFCLDTDSKKAVLWRTTDGKALEEAWLAEIKDEITKSKLSLSDVILKRRHERAIKRSGRFKRWWCDRQDPPLPGCPPPEN